MNALILIFSFCGTFVVGCLIIALAGAAAAFAGAGLGLVSSVRVFRASEDSGLTRGLLWGAVAGVLLALYTIFTSGLVAAFLTAIGLAVVMLAIAGIVMLVLPDPRYNRLSDSGDYVDNYPY